MDRPLLSQGKKEKTFSREFSKKILTINKIA